MKVSKPVLFTLIGAVLIIIYLFFFAGPKKTPPPKLPDTQVAAKTTPQVVEKIKEKGGELKKVTSVDALWRNDPFLLPSIPKKEEDRPYTPLKLVGIIEGSDGRYAIFGSNIVKKGDLIGEDKVQEIGRDRVILVRKGQRKVISVSDAERMETLKPSPWEGKK